jgi:hypothetical protein
MNEMQPSKPSQNRLGQVGHTPETSKGHQFEGFSGEIIGPSLSPKVGMMCAQGVPSAHVVRKPRGAAEESRE